jgi:hypothetical protein
MKKAISLICLAALGTALMTGCYVPATQTNQGAAVGGAVGATTGLLLDRRHPWRGGIIGGVLGAMVGATLGDISERAAMEAAQSQRPAEYRTEDGRGLYRAEPLGYSAGTRCTRVHERVWQDGQLVRDQVREVCTSDTNRPGY